ncbi:MAG: Membrane protein involved in the export of O-antigen and teichoic acid [Parcubacteria group bacterium GW2011_GWA1_47_9]|nr:MAG: Membrane protein involved in the export of O-antigen and teichoic acid [Parcubacteria group bacterium GW2011_GWA1_47_9]
MLLLILNYCVQTLYLKHMLNIYSSKILKNFLSLSAGQALTKIISLISVPIIARQLGATNFGTYTLAFSFVLIFSGFSDLGIHQLTIREGSKNKEENNSLFSNALVIRLILAIFFFVIAIGTVYWLDYPNATKQLILILSILIVTNALVNTIVSVLHAQEKMSYSASLLFIQSILTPLTIIPLLYLDISLKNAFAALIIVNLVFTIVIERYFFRKITNFSYQLINLRIWHQILKDSWPYALMAASWVIYINNGSIVLSKITDISNVGIYNAGQVLIVSLFFIPGSLMMALYPAFSRSVVKSGKKELKKIAEMILKILLMVILPAAILIFLFSNSVVHVLYGSNFTDTAIVLRWLSLALVMHFINSPLGYIILSTEKIKKYVLFDILILVVNLSLGIYMSINYGLIGPAIAIFCSECLTFIIRLLFIKKNLHFGISIKSILNLRLLNQNG